MNTTCCCGTPCGAAAGASVGGTVGVSTCTGTGSGAGAAGAATWPLLVPLACWVSLRCISAVARLYNPAAMVGRDKARCLVGTFPHPPRLEPCLRLSPHTAQHFQISLGLSSVAFGAEYLHVVRAVCILWSFELCIWLDMVNLYFPWVECFLAPCTDGTIPEKYFISQVYLPRPVFSESDVVVAEE